MNMWNTSGSGYINSITLAQSAGNVYATTIYVRLNARLPVNTSNSETILHTSTNATSTPVICSGTVNCTSPPTVVSPVIYCLNALVTPLTATGTSLKWVDFGSGCVGKTTWTNSTFKTYNSGTNYTFFTTSISNLTVNSIDVYTDDYCDLNSTTLTIEYYNGSTWALVGTSKSISAGGIQYGSLLIAIFKGG